MRKKGFTLIELLIVIAIIAILAVIIIVAINPGKILAKSRDSQRFSDVTSLATALNLYLADNQILPTEKVKSTDGATDNARKLNDGTGWLTSVNFKLVSSGAPISALPLDPLNTTAFHYVVGTDATTKSYEIMCVFENEDNTPKQSSDGGNSPLYYEVGTDLTILVTADY